MLKKLLYNKYKVVNIDKKRLPYTSEELLKVLYDKHNVICFEYGEGLRILPYTGLAPDFLGRATQFQPIPVIGTEAYPLLSLDQVVKYEENSLRGSAFTPYSYCSCDIDKYIEELTLLDEAILINSKQVFIPFIAKCPSSKNAQALKSLLTNIFGKEYANLIVETSIKEGISGTYLEVTNMQVFTQTLQDTKKKILEEAFLYLGVGAPAGKLAHESVQEVTANEKITDLLDNVMYSKISEFISEINTKFGTNMQVLKMF